MAFEAMRFEELLKKVSTDDTERQSKRERHDKLNTKRNISRNQAVWCTMPIVWEMEKHTAAAAKSLQSCPTLCDPMDGSPPGSPVPGILQARTLEWVAISFSNAWKWKVKVKSLVVPDS